METHFCCPADSESPRKAVHLDPLEFPKAGRETVLLGPGSA